ncbi:MAG: electron transfer flavoprotein subunit alpha/FixB family protein [Spirochaetaceae bacterium]|jgi:electron transfer flavoprotein alpha subunit|nr:electron transfer flavoprotein subunit alpha/FixB family protein [Spirochaetaceae bacterium]
MIRTLVCVENALWRDSVDLVGAARRFAGKEANEAYAFTLNLDDRDAEAAIDNVFDMVIRARDDRICSYDAPGVACCVERLYEEYGFDCVFFPASAFGRILAPQTAARLQCALCADVVKIERKEDAGSAALGVHFIRPVFDAKMFAAVCGNGKPVMASIRAGLFQYEGTNEGTKKALVRVWTPPSPPPESAGLKLLSVRKKAETCDIREKDLLIAVGAGAARYFEEARKLAVSLDGAAAASRKLVDSGVADRSIQVGQSGKTVSPRVYIALGIRGSAQHIAGLQNVGCLVAVNTDRDAPLCALADMVAVSDAAAFIREMKNRMENVNPVQSFDRAKPKHSFHEAVPKPHL